MDIRPLLNVYSLRAVYSYSVRNTSIGIQQHLRLILGLISIISHYTSRNNSTASYSPRFLGTRPARSRSMNSLHQGMKNHWIRGRGDWLVSLKETKEGSVLRPIRPLLGVGNPLDWSPSTTVAVRKKTKKRRTKKNSPFWQRTFAEPIRRTHLFFYFMQGCGSVG